MRPALLLAVVVLFASRTTRADSWYPPRPMVAASADGKWYVIVQPTEGEYSPVEFLLVKAGESKDPLPRGPAPGGFGAVKPLAPREGDVVVAKGSGFMPMEIRCRNEGNGFVLFESYASVGQGISAAAYDAKGNEVWRRSLSDFFTPSRIEAFSHTTSSIWWYSGLWLDEAAGDLVATVYGTPPEILRVSLRDGSSRPGKPEDLLGRIGLGTAEEQIAALDVALEVKPKGLLDAAQESFGRTDLPLGVRLRLAVALARGGDLAGRDLLRISTQEGTEPAARKFAVAHLSEVLGSAAIPMLQDLMRGTAGDVWWSAVEGLVALGEEAVPTLIAMLGEEGETTDYRGGAAHGLGRMGATARTAIPALVHATQHAPEYVANAALNAAVAIAPPEELTPLLIPILAKGSTQDGRLSSYFDDHPSRDAIPALIEALSRHDEGSTGYEHDTLVSALEKSSGASGVGATAAAWRAWWARQVK